MSVTSMTGFGSGSAVEGAEQIDVELRSVNGKFCDVKARLPRELAALEIDFVKVIKERLARGSIDASVRHKTVGEPPSVVKVNGALVTAYARELTAAAREAHIAETLSIGDLVEMQGVVQLEERAPDFAATQKALKTATETALAALVGVRRREGAALEADLRGRAANIRRLGDQLGTAAPAAVATHRERLRARLTELSAGVQIDPGRMEQEVIMFAERSDIAEEITRLRAHVDELERLLAQSGPSGRQLDFLAQEMNREANTAGSKSQSPDLSRMVVELKTEIERVREQVQNVE